MKNIKFWIPVFCCTLCLLLLASCASDQKASESTSAASSQTESVVSEASSMVEESSTSAEETSNTVEYTMPITVDYASEEMLNDTDSYLHFTDETVSNNDWNLVFTTDTAVQDFKFLALDESTVLTIESVLYTIEELSTEKPFVASTYINDATANRGISFTDVNGETRYYAVSFSGADGSISLEEFFVD